MFELFYWIVNFPPSWDKSTYAGL